MGQYKHINIKLTIIWAEIIQNEVFIISSIPSSISKQ